MTRVVPPPAIRRLFAFPNPVNEVAARTVAAGVVVLTLATMASGALWMTAVIAAGFLARVLTGPTLSPLGQIATRLVAPALGRAKLVPGPPKRFAQGIGASLSVTAAVLHFMVGAPVVVYGLLAVITLAAALESGFGYCLGCKAFALLMRAGLVPDTVCLECADVSRRLAANPV